MLPAASIRVIDPRNYWTWSELFGSGIGVGLINYLPSLFGGVILVSGVIFGLLLIVLFPVIFIGFVSSKIRDWCSAYLLGIGIGTAYLVPALLLFLLQIVIEMKLAWLLVLLIAIAVIAQIPGVIASGVWYVVYRLGPPRIIQDGTRCPGCGYSLVGNQSMVCPECGRAYTFTELGVTAEKFIETGRSTV
ncbi:MAG: hypothetical protein HJJLKODD_00933 [Phycisphaerae bacterium]|nr:hypothetical protein [Phycisphaerae bacterium]